MIDVFRKAVMAGIGLITESSEMMKEVIDDLIRKGEISRKEGEKLLKEFLKKGEEARTEITAALHKGAEDVLSRADIATKDDIERLAKKVALLEKKVREVAKSK